MIEYDSRGPDVCLQRKNAIQTATASRTISTAAPRFALERAFRGLYVANNEIEISSTMRT